MSLWPLVFPGGVLLGLLSLAPGWIASSPWWAKNLQFYAYAVLGVGILLAVIFRQFRGLLFFLFGAFFWALVHYQSWAAFSLTWRVLLFLAPVNAALVLFAPGKGLLRFRNLAVPLLFAGEIFLLAWQLNAHPAAVLHALETQPLRFLGGFLSGILLWLPVWVMAGYLHYKRRDPVDRGLLWASAGLYLGLLLHPRMVVSGVYWLGAGIILILALLEKAHRLAYHDELTLIPARRAMNDFLDTLRPPFAVAMVDLDRFKQINDSHGHAVGDQVLKKVAAHLQSVRDGGRVFRYGGEEFAVLFPGKSKGEVWSALEDLRLRIHRDPFILREPDRPIAKPSSPRPAREPQKNILVTVSIGVAEASGRDKADPHAVLKEADEALYRAKRSGRNCVKD